MTDLKVPFFRPDIGDAEIEEVARVMRSGWLTSGPAVHRFEAEFGAAVRARHAVAVNSCTAALHLAVEALGLRAGDGVLVPTMTFAASAEIVRYLGAVPILVDCDPVTLNLDLADAQRKLEQAQAGRIPRTGPRVGRVAGLVTVHVGGLLLDIEAARAWAERNGLWIVEDAAHAFPAASRPGPQGEWKRCGEDTAAVSCFSFYANKTITTGEGGMAVTGDAALADRMRMMSLHGLSQDAWNRYAGGKGWDYRIVAPGYKYNLTDLAAAIGLCQLERAEAMRRRREDVAAHYRAALEPIEEIELPPDDPDRIHAWHLYPIRLRLDRLAIDRNAVMDLLKEAGIGCSVHWRPLHLHPYYEQAFQWSPSDLPVASDVWPRLISLPIFPGMTGGEIDAVVAALRRICFRSRRVPAGVSGAAG